MDRSEEALRGGKKHLARAIAAPLNLRLRR
jgi:hypothetical protein